MRKISQLPIVKEVNSNFPSGAILNETDTASGTPVVREIYNDPLVNFYKLLELVGITATGLEDSEANGYQIIEALKKLPNSLNDSEQILTLTGTVWSIPKAIELLPNKYFFIAKAADAYASGGIYTFKGTGATTYNFTSSGFNASDEVLLILDTSGVRAFSLSFLDSVSDEVSTVMGSPLAFNDSDKMYYQTDGRLISDVPTVNYLENIIRVDVSNGTVIVNDIIITNGYVLCFCFIASTNTYFFRQFALTDLSASTAVTISGASFATASNLSPYVYFKSGVVYVTNDMNSTTYDYNINKLNYNPVAGTLTNVSTVSLDVSFIKTSNAVVKTDLLYTLNSGILSSFNLNTGVKIILGDYGGISGNIFGFNNKIYFGSGEIAKSWLL